MKLTYTTYKLTFKEPAGTSRGYLKTKTSYFLKVVDGEREGIGECGLLAGLSADDRPNYEEKLRKLANNFSLKIKSSYQWINELREWPSIQAGLEMALLDLQSSHKVLFPSAFTRGAAMQPINGLIWMGNKDFMRQQIEEKLKLGFKVLKMKIGALDWETEYLILKEIRRQFSSEVLELRVDANGSFSDSEATYVLDKLAALKVHSIEQPIKARQWKSMAELCNRTPLPIALDEELIGVFEPEHKLQMLDTIKPQFIILKPSFIGGFAQAEWWIKEAKHREIGWWATSALESNLGLSAIAQWNFKQDNNVASGLGTGSLYERNWQAPLFINNGQLGYNPREKWQPPADFSW